MEYNFREIEKKWHEYWIANKIDMSKISYDIWVAKYQQKYTYSKTSMWQASNTGSVKGVNGNVDIDYLYKDYTQIIPGNTWRTILLSEPCDAESGVDQRWSELVLYECGGQSVHRMAGAFGQKVLFGGGRSYDYRLEDAGRRLALL